MRIQFDPEKNPLPSTHPLPRHLNEFADLGVEFIPIPLFGSSVPNMKLNVASEMMEVAEISGELRGVHTIAEGTSGNTGLSLGIVAPYYGIRRVIANVKRDVAPGKLEQLRLVGVESRYPDPEFNLSPVEEARRLGMQKGWFNPDQYRNPANWQAHFKYTGPHVWKQTGGKISVFCAPIGTAGTIVGVSKFLKEQNAGIRIVGGALSPGHAVPGVRTVEEIQPDFEWRAAINALLLCETKDSYRESRNLCLAGWMYGPGSGLSFSAAKRFVQSRNLSNELDMLRNKDGAIVVGFACGDTAIPYLEKYSKELSDSELRPLDPDLIVD